MRQSNLSKSFVLAVAFAVSASAIQAPIYGQCGEDSVKCPTGYKCQFVNPNYSQCVPIKYSEPKVEREVPELETSTLSKRAPPAVFDPVVGADSCSCQPRRNINTLQSSYPAVFNMFILALQALQQTPENQDISWYQIAGIHGRPFIKWQQVAADQWNPNRPYCTHASRLFTTWHRPYIVLLEQSLFRKSKQIAAQFSGQSYATYSAAAEQFRLPYWDWAARATGSSCLPPVTMQPTISVTRPGTAGVPQTLTIANPLFQYNFLTPAYLTTYFNSYFSQWAYTRRRPGPLSGGGISNNALACSAMNSGHTTRRTQVYNALNNGNYNTFSSQLEGIHDTIHVTVGGSNPSGHMATIDVAAFDPIFWLHHCNIDRLMALYQAAHPGIYLTAGPAMATSGRVVPGIDGPQDNLNTQLYPFRHPDGSFFKSEELKTAASIWNLKYGYDEVPCSYASLPATTLKTYAQSRINSLYGPTIVFPGPFTPVRDVFVRNDFNMRTVIDSSEIPGSWTLHAFLGKVNANPAEYETSPYRIASISSFGNYGERKDPMIYDNEIGISDVLYERKVDYTYDNIVKYLTENLYWAVTTDDEEIKEIPISSIKTLRIGVYTAPGNYTDPDSDTGVPPVYGTPTYLPEITRGKPGGIQSDKEILYPTLLNGTQVNLEALRQ